VLWQRPLTADASGTPCLDDRWFEC
jgi:hypothetical protein